MTTTRHPSAAPYGDVDRCVLVCTAHRCGALLDGPAGDGLPALRAAVADSRRALLVSTGCLGGCAAGPLMALSATSIEAGGSGSQGTGSSSQGTGSSTGSAGPAAGQSRRLQATSTCWLGPMDAALTRSLAQWLRAGGPRHCPLPDDLAEVRLPGHGAAT